MSLIINKSCGRCRRDISVPVASLEKGLEIQQADEKKAEGAAKLKALVEELKTSGALPDLFTAQVSGDTVHVVSQVRLCDEADAKRSCTKTIAHFVDQFDTLPERAPRGSKKKAAGETNEPANSTGDATPAQ
jgi:hypothetical protein